MKKEIQQNEKYFNRIEIAEKTNKSLSRLRGAHIHEATNIRMMLLSLARLGEEEKFKTHMDRANKLLKKAYSN